MPTTLHDIPDKLLELILLNLASPVWIIRAAATCRGWRHTVTSERFRLGLLRRHPPDVAGYYYPPPLSGGNPKFVPSPSPAITAIDRSVFSLDFLPGGGRSWKLTDSSSSLLLLAKRKGGRMSRRFPDLVVCEPLTRRYRLVPRPAKMKHLDCLGVFLYARSYNDHEHFQVTFVLYEYFAGLSGEDGTVKSCVFGSGWRGMGHWTTSPRAERPARGGGLRLHLRRKDSLRFVGRDGDTSFWWVKDDQAPKWLACAHWNGSFKVIVLPERIQRLCIDESRFRFVDVGDHRMRIVCLDGRTLKFFARRYWDGYNGGGSDWMLEKNIDLGVATQGLPGRTEEYFGDDAVTAKILKVRRECVVLVAGDEMWPFSVNVKNMRVERWSKCYDEAYRYELPWPPRLQACLYPCRRRRRGPCYRTCTCY